MTRKMKRRWQREMKQAMARKVLPMAMTAGIILGSCGYVLAQPGDGEITAGSGRIDTNGSTTTITQTTDKLAIDWQSFNIGNGESVIFIQPGTSSIALNRVVGNDVSAIYGTLSANGKVFLINPNGILFGSNAQVDVGGLVASALSISNEDFLAGNYTFQNNGFAGAIANDGQIIATDGGYVVLLGSQVDNRGIIVARQGTVALGAGDRISLDFYGDGLLNLAVDQAAVNASVANHHLIQADGGRVLMTARTADALAGTVVNNTGLIQARSIREQDGVIILYGGTNGTVDVGGTLDASAPNGGDGGFIETSGAYVKIGDNTRVTTLAASGRNGTWLIDPDGFTIAPSGGNMTGLAVSNALSGGNFSIESIDGNINVNDTVTWDANTLTLIAFDDINVNSVMTAKGTAALNLQPGSGKVNMGLGGNGFYGRVDFYQADGITPRGGTGFLTINGQGYTVITNIDDLQGISSNISGHYFLGVDIDATATATWNDGYGGVTGFIPLATYWTHFNGIFDGGGHAIDGLYINSDSAGGLFAYSDGTIRNVGLTNVNMNTRFGHSIGGLAAQNWGSIYNCYSAGNVIAIGNSGYAGGLVGENYGSGSIRNSYSMGNVSGNGDGITIGGLVGGNYGSVDGSYSTADVNGISNDGYNGGIGGLVGRGWNGSITNSYSTGDLNGTGNKLNIGGLIGFNFGNINNSYGMGTASGVGDDNCIGGLVGWHYGGNIINTYSLVNVNGEGNRNRIGGLVGNNFSFSATPAIIENGYSIGTVSGSNGFIGGFAGYNMGTIRSGYWDVDTSGLSTGIGSGNGGVTGLYSNPDSLSVDINRKSAYAASSYNGWDIAATGGSNAVWRIYDGQTYPLLKAFLTPLTVTADEVLTYNGQFQSAGVTYITPDGSPVNTALLRGTVQLDGGGVNVGDYTVTPSGLSSMQQGYDITYVNGTLTIVPATLTITANNATKTYNGLAYSGGNGVIYNGFVNGEDASVLNGSLSYSGDAQGALNAKTYVITPGGFSSLNYDITYLDGTLTINPAALTVTAVTNTKIYDGTTDAAAVPIVTGLQGNDELVGLRLQYASKHVGTSIVLTPVFTINDGNGGNNYTVTIQTATGMITPADLVVAVNNAGRYMGMPNPDFTVTSIGLRGTDTLSSLTGTLEFSTSATIDSMPGQYTISASGLSSFNYNINFVDGILTVHANSPAFNDAVAGGLGFEGVAVERYGWAPRNDLWLTVNQPGLNSEGVEWLQF